MRMCEHFDDSCVRSPFLGNYSNVSVCALATLNSAWGVCKWCGQVPGLAGDRTAGNLGETYDLQSRHVWGSHRILVSGIVYLTNQKSVESVSVKARHFTLFKGKAHLPCALALEMTDLFYVILGRPLALVVRPELNKDNYYSSSCVFNLSHDFLYQVCSWRITDSKCVKCYPEICSS